MTSPELQPDPCLDEKEAAWTTLHSLSSLRLTLESILRDSTAPRTPPLLEFPLKIETDSTETKLQLPLKTQPPLARLKSDQLALKTSQLKKARELYQDRLHQLQQGTRAIFGEIWGRRICLMVDTSNQHAFKEREIEDSDCEENGSREKEEEGREEERLEFAECRNSLKQLFEEQLSHKHRVYLLELGSEEPDSSPTPLNFRKNRERSKMVAGQWVESLKGSGGMCSLLTGLETALELTDIDTLLIVMGSKPQEEKNTLVDFLRERKAPNSHIHIHLVTHLCESSTREMVAEVASETGAHYHSYSQTADSSSGVCVEDTEIDTLRAELSQAEETIPELETLQLGNISDKVIHILTQLNITCCQFDELTPCSPEDSHLPVTSGDWLANHSLEALGLSIYHVLAPNAYRQVKTRVTHSPDTKSIVPSVVYDETMPQFTWHDGTLKYLHVDVHLLEGYQAQVERYITQLRERINWLTSGSRVPFGVLSEKRVLLLVEFSGATLPFVSQLQNCLRLLLLEQLSHTAEFNIMRVGGECCSWRPSFTKKTPQSLSDAWVWLLSQSPSGSAPSLLPALETAFKPDREVGVYLILSSLPAENTETVCSFLREKTSTQENVHVNVVFYRQCPPSENHAVAGIRFEEGYYANEQELTRCLQQIAGAGKGRFHSFKGPDTVSSGDIDELARELKKAQEHLQMAETTLSDYRSFCKRFVPPAVSYSPPPPLSDPPPLYPRPTTAFLCRLNTVSRRIPRSVSDSHLSHRRPRQKHHTRHTKTCAFYLDKNLQKGFAFERWAAFGTPVHKKPQKTESESISEWLLKYGLENLGLKFRKFEVRKRHQRSHKKTYRHIDKKGEIVELYADRQGLKNFTQRLRQARDGYTQKLHELEKGWQNFLGCISESKVFFLIDASSSMTGGFRDLQTALADFLHHRPQSLKHFNLVAYSSCVRKWQEALSPVSDETMSEAAQWLSQLKPEGSSCLLHALKLSLESGAKIVYLITDGTADHTHDFLLSQLPQLRRWYGQQWKINTVAFHCSLESSFCFLSDLAHRTSGRYHSYPWSAAEASATKLLQNRFLGDDVLKLVQEISSAEDQLNQASQYL